MGYIPFVTIDFELLRFNLEAYLETVKKQIQVHEAATEEYKKEKERNTGVRNQYLENVKTFHGETTNKISEYFAELVKKRNEGADNICSWETEKKQHEREQQAIIDGGRKEHDRREAERKNEHLESENQNLVGAAKTQKEQITQSWRASAQKMQAAMRAALESLAQTEKTKKAIVASCESKLSETQKRKQELLLRLDEIVQDKQQYANLGLASYPNSIVGLYDQKSITNAISLLDNGVSAVRVALEKLGTFKNQESINELAEKIKECLKNLDSKIADHNSKVNEFLEACKQYKENAEQECARYNRELAEKKWVDAHNQEEREKQRKREAEIVSINTANSKKLRDVEVARQNAKKVAEDQNRSALKEWRKKECEIHEEHEQQRMKYQDELMGWQLKKQASDKAWQAKQKQNELERIVWFESLDQELNRLKNNLETDMQALEAKNSFIQCLLDGNQPSEEEKTVEAVTSANNNPKVMDQACGNVSSLARHNAEKKANENGCAFRKNLSDEERESLTRLCVECKELCNLYQIYLLQLESMREKMTEAANKDKNEQIGSRMNELGHIISNIRTLQVELNGQAQEWQKRADTQINNLKADHTK